MNIKKTFSLDLGNNSTDALYSNKDILYHKYVMNGDIKEDHWFINNIDTNITTNTIEPYQEYQDINIENLNEITIGDYFNQLNQRINNIQRDLTYWDVYHIRDQVTDYRELNAKFDDLAPGESLVFNAEKNYVAEDGTVYSRGDVIVKTLDEEAILIKALSGGIYAPIKIQKLNNKYVIEYKFFPTMPEPNTSQTLSVTGGSFLTELTETIKYTDFDFNVSNQPYNQYQAFSGTCTFPVLKTTTSPAQEIRPVIKFFKETDANKEEYYLDFTLTSNNNQWTVTVDNCPDDLYIAVK